MTTSTDRLKTFRKMVLTEPVEAVLVSGPSNVRYLSGFTGSYGYVFMTRKWACLLTDGRYETQAAQEVGHMAVRVESRPLWEAVGDLGREKGVRVLGFEPAHTGYELYQSLRKAGFRLRPLHRKVEELRQLKSDHEMRAIRRAVRIAEESFLAVQGLIRPGTSERDLAAALECEIRKRGSDRLPFEAIVATGRRSSLPHARPTSRKLKAGDLLVVDWGAEYNGYFSDMTRSFILGGAAGEKKKVYDIVLEAQRAAVRVVLPGISLKAVDKAARDVIEGYGYGLFFNHGTGHGVGLDVHEMPRVSRMGKGPVEEGMVFTVEPGIYIPDMGGVRIEDMIHVTREGARPLTRLPVEPYVGGS